jgi:Uma2 family endonuclease
MPRSRLTADHVLGMVAAGIIRKDEHLELLDGTLVNKSAMGPLQATATTILADRLRAAYAGRARVREEKPLAASVYSLPEPDIAVVRDGSYGAHHPGGADAILVVELAWPSQAEDRSKAAIYAAAQVPVYWLVDLVNRKVEVRTQPEPVGYRTVDVLGEADVISLPELGERWPVRDLLP